MWVLSNDNRLSKSLVPKVSANIQKASAKPCPKQVSVVPSENDNLNNPSEFIIIPINFFKLCEQSIRKLENVKRFKGNSLLRIVKQCGMMGLEGVTETTDFRCCMLLIYNDGTACQACPGRFLMEYRVECPRIRLGTPW